MSPRRRRPRPTNEEIQRQCARDLIRLAAIMEPCTFKTPVACELIATNVTGLLADIVAGTIPAIQLRRETDRLIEFIPSFEIIDEYGGDSPYARGFERGFETAMQRREEAQS